MRSRISIIKRSVLLSTVIVLFIFGCQGALNPLTWKTQIERFVSPQQLIQPEKVAPFYQEMREEIKRDPEDIFWYIKFRIKYRNDLANYGALNHLATAEEILLREQDDCDGYAVVTCSVLRRAGYTAYAVIGPSHAWVEVEAEEPLLIDYKGGDWFVKFNESSCAWKVESYLLMVLEEFFLLVALFSILIYSYEKGVFTFIGDLVGYMKYVILLFFIFAVIIVIFARFWTPGTIVFCVSALVVMEIVSRLRKYYTDWSKKTQNK